MTNRREFLQAAAIAALPAVAGANARVGDARSGSYAPVALHAVLMDERYAESRAFAARLAARGARVHSVPNGDITDVWLQQIEPAWRRQPVGVAGLTAPAALFCLEQLAWSSGLRVVFHAEHIVRPSWAPEHEVLRGAIEAGLQARDLAHYGPLWPGRVADAITAHRSSVGRQRIGPSDAGLEPFLPAGAGLLTSWLIAAA